MSIITQGIITPGIITPGIVSSGLFGSGDGAGGCSGILITIGTDGSVAAGYLRSTYGTVDPTETSDGHIIRSFRVTSQDLFIIEFGLSGNEKPDSIGDTLSIQVPKYGVVFLGWNVANDFYSGSAPALYNQWSNMIDEEVCIKYTLNPSILFYAATYLNDYTSVVQKVGIGLPTTTHAGMWALDHEGVARKFPANEPVWKGARLEINGMLLVMRTTGAAETITLPLTGTNNLSIDWGDGSQEAVTTASPSHEYATADDYTIEISGTATKFYFNNAGDKDKLIKVLNLGDVSWSELLSAFFGCSSIIEFNNGTGDVSPVTSFYLMMYGWTSLTTPPEFSNWDVSSGTNFYGMMNSWNSITTPPVFSDWDVSSGTNFAYMMYNWSSLTTPPVFADWDVSSVTSFYGMMNNWTSLTTPPEFSNWNVSSGIDFSYMMRDWNSITTPPEFSNWDVSSGTNFAYMLYGWTAAGAVDIGIDSWVITSATNMASFLQGTTLTTACYDRTLIAWDALDIPGLSTGIHFGNSKYTPGGAAEAARTSLQSKVGTITDGGAA